MTYKSPEIDVFAEFIEALYDTKNFMLSNPRLFSGTKKPAKERREMAQLILGNVAIIGGYRNDEHLAQLFSKAGYDISKSLISAYRLGTCSPSYARYGDFIDATITFAENAFLERNPG